MKRHEAVGFLDPGEVFAAVLCPICGETQPVAAVRGKHRCVVTGQSFTVAALSLAKLSDLFCAIGRVTNRQRRALTALKLALELPAETLAPFADAARRMNAGVLNERWRIPDAMLRGSGLAATIPKGVASVEW